MEEEALSQGTNGSILQKPLLSYYLPESKLAIFIKITNAYTDPFYGIAKHKKIEDNLHLLRRISKYVLNVDRTDPYISPLFGSFEKFPKVTLICGTAELDESDSDRVYDKMKNTNIDVELYKFEGMCHCFQLFSFLPESKTAYKLVKARILEDTK